MAAKGAQVLVSLVTYNGLRWLPGCLSSLRDQTLPDFELRIVDNASTDGTQEVLRDHAAGDRRVSLTELEANVGFAAAHNLNLMASNADFVMLLNQDVELDAGFLEAALNALADLSQVGAVQGRLRRLAGPGERTSVLDSTGLVMHRDRRVVARRQGETEDDRDLVAGPVWGADGPAPVYRSAALLDVVEPRTGGGREVLDEDFFMYKEDVDLAWRLRKHGWRTWYEPSALAWHARGTGGRPDRGVVDLVRADREIPRWIKATSWRNHRLMQIKNEDAGEYLRDLPWIARRELMSLGFTTIVDSKRLAMVGDLMRSANAAVAKRRAQSPSAVPSTTTTAEVAQAVRQRGFS